MTDDQTVVLGEEFENFGRVNGISFRGTIHKTTGSTGLPCYILTFENSDVQAIIPREKVVYLTTDNAKQNAAVPELPE